MGAFLRGSAYSFLANLGISIVGGAYQAIQDLELRKDEILDPTKGMDEQGKVMYYSLMQFRKSSDWQGFNRWFDRNVNGEVPMSQRISIWESLGKHV